MNVAPSSMSAMLASRRKDLLCAIEFYAPTYVPSSTRGFEPDNAVARFATETVPVYVFRSGVTVSYVRSVFSMPSLSRVMGKQSNSVTVQISNVPKSDTPTIQPIASFVLNNEIEGMRMVIRLLSRANLTDILAPLSWVLFVGKCQRQDGFDRQRGTITARQDLGQIEAVMPPKVFQKDCGLDFGGPECLGTELLTEKNAAYQAAFAALGHKGCNKTHGQCSDFDNLKFNQGIRVAQIQGSFIYKPHHGLLYKLIRYSTPIGYVASRLLGSKSQTIGNSLEDGTPYGKAIPIVLGRWLMFGFPLQFQDEGENIKFMMAFARGPVVDLLNIRCTNPEFSQPFDIIKHYGRYGGEADQAEDTVFPLGGFFSRLAYVTGAVAGSDIVVVDPAPDIVAMIAGVAANAPVRFGDSIAGEGTETIGQYNYISAGWNDNPADLAAYVLNEPALLNNPRDFFDGFRSVKTSAYCDGAVRDVSNAERLILPNTEIGKAGVEYKRYNTTGLIYGTNPIFTGNLPVAGPAHEVDYEYYDPSSPPASVALKTFYRKRFTCNLALTEQKKALDVLYDTILPSFRGFLSWDTHGRIGIRSERPADSTLLRNDILAGSTTIDVKDAYLWSQLWNENNNPLIGEILIGVGLTSSEVRNVTSVDYTADGNDVTLEVSATGAGTITTTGFAGGSTSTPASALITVSGDFAKDDEVTAMIDGEEITYRVGRNENHKSVGPSLAFAINAHPVIQKYVIAHCGGGQFTGEVEINLEVKYGTLHLSSALGSEFNALENDHSLDEETIRVMMSFAGKRLRSANTTKANILNGSFKYLGSDGQTRYNQFKGTFKNPLRDFADQPEVVNDYDHQDEVHGEIKPLEIDLSAVDSYNQASRLLNGANAKYGDGTDFFTWGSNGLALQIEEGDVVCVSHDSGAFVNVPVRTESLTVNSQYEVTFKDRIYSTSMYDDLVEQTDVPLPSKLGGFGDPPSGIAFNSVVFPPNGLEQSTDGSLGITTIRGGAIFTTRRFATHAFVRLIKRGGVTVNEQVAVIFPDDDLEATFEFLASADGLYTVELEVCNQWSCNSTKPTADIIIGFGTLFGIAKQGGILIIKQGGTIMEQPHV